jgi:hypothetical protein
MERLGIRRKAKFNLVKDIKSNDMFGKSVYGKDRYGKTQANISKESKEVISAGWTIYDPAERGFILKPKCEAPIKDWINRRNPLSYWIAVCITNHSNNTIDCFELEFETTSLLEIEGVYVEGFERAISYYKERASKTGRIKYVITIPEESPISLPKRGSLRLYIDIHSDECGQHYTLEKGLIRTEHYNIPLPDLDFYYSCELSNIRKDRKVVEMSYAESFIDRTLAFVLNESVEDLDKVISCYWGMLGLVKAKERRVMRYVNLLSKLEELAGNTKFYNLICDCMNIEVLKDPNVKKNLDQLRKMPDYDALLSEKTLKKIEDCLIDALLYLTDIKLKSFTIDL